MLSVLLAASLILPSCSTASVQRPPEDEVLYFIMPDRFLDGDPGNNYGDDTQKGNAKEDVLRHGYLPTHKGYYHGGDLRGVMMALPYLDDLGVTALWLAPVFKNKAVQSDGGSLHRHSSGYHGYWILDFLNIDPHLGTNEDLKELVRQAHQRGIKVYLDIVTNHTADVIRLQPWPDRDYERQGGYVSKESMPYRDSQGRPFDDADMAYKGSASKSFPAMDANGFPYRAVVPPDELEAKHPAWLNDPTNYHNRGNSSFRDESSLYGDFYGLDDLFTEKPEVVKGMIDIYSHWIRKYRIDGFRIDTARHVNVEFWQAFAPAMVQAAKRIRMHHFYAFGEVADEHGRPEVLSYFTTQARMQGILDFGFQKAAWQFASKSQPTVRLQEFFALDDYYTDADSQVTTLPTFLGNHDQGRFGRYLLRDNPRADDKELLARAILAHTLMFFTRGTPVIYYGDEQGFTGDGGDKDAREDMFPSQVTVYNDNKLIGTERTTAELNFDISHPLYQAIRRMAKVYRENTGLRRGAQIFRLASQQAGLYAFSRIDASDKIECLVALNNSPTAIAGTHIPTYNANQGFDLIYSQPPARETLGRSNGQGHLAVQLEPFGVKVYRANTPIAAPGVKPQLTIAHPQNGQTLQAKRKYDSGYHMPERIEVRADLDQTVFGQVMFQISAAGESYKPLGVDRTPPYRIFLDPFPYVGKRVTIQATFEDTFGGSSSATITGLTVQEP